MRHLLSVPAMRPPGSPRTGDLAGSNTSEPRGSAPRERDHRGGDHPVPSRTRQLSPPSPRVLQREAAGGQGVALAEGAFLSAPREARGGMLPLRASLRFGPGPRRGPAPSRRQAPRIAEGPPPHRLGCRRRPPCARGPVRWRTAPHRRPEGPQRGCSLEGLSVSWRSSCGFWAACANRA